jgi:hypothetical protein
MDHFDSPDASEFAPQSVLIVNSSHANVDGGFDPLDGKQTSTVEVQFYLGMAAIAAEDEIARAVHMVRLKSALIRRRHRLLSAQTLGSQVLCAPAVCFHPPCDGMSPPSSLRL